ncbi:hypothetical protein JCM10212_005832 [Sporobolomyces blumeae]
MPQRNQPVTRNRLPSLAEVLRRNTRPPVDLYCYYLFLQREGAEDTLDFWLDVQQHENLCRAYFKDLRKSGRLVKHDWPQYASLARTRGSIYGNVTGIRRGQSDAATTTDDEFDTSRELTTGGEGADEATRSRSSVAGPERTSDFDPYLAARDAGSRKGSIGPDGLESPSSRAGGEYIGTHDAEQQAGRLSVATDPRPPHQLDARYPARTPSPRPSGASGSAYPLSPTLKALYPHDDDPDDDDRDELDAPAGGLRRRPRPHHKRHSTAAQPFIPRDAAINRTDLIASAERIYSRYLMPGADKEIYLPSALRITDFPISSSVLPAVSHPDYDREADAQARVPDMFHPQKEYVYRALEQDSFPRFLRAKAFGNLTPISALVRLAIGLVALWAGLATAFAFIFLDTKPKVKRLWIILPFTFAIVNLVAHSYDLDPLMVFMGLSETTPFRTIGIREPYVRKLLFGRALWVTFLSAAIIAVLTVIFWAVPGHRL